MKTVLLYTLLCVGYILGLQACIKDEPQSDYITILNEEDNESDYKYAYECIGKQIPVHEEGDTEYVRPIFLLYTNNSYREGQRIEYINREDSTYNVDWLDATEYNKIANHN